ncbi:MAG: Uma2 family endonuclease [Deltaproteobacteria bacterium]|nr:Uma2 family endonuclease [Deltaproteobacteria bacterium]
MQTNILSGDYKIQYTYADYLAINDDKRYEVMEGHIMMVPAPNTFHQRISSEIGYLFVKYVKENDLGSVFLAPTDVVLSDDVVVQPDILFISKERAGIIGDKAIMGAPDIVVEIISPSSSFNDSVRKREIYQRFGVKEYWLVFPEEKAIEVMTLENGIYRELCSAKEQGSVRSKFLPRFEVDLKDVF